MMLPGKPLPLVMPSRTHCPGVKRNVGLRDTRTENSFSVQRRMDRMRSAVAFSRGSWGTARRYVCAECINHPLATNAAACEGLRQDLPTCNDPKRHTVRLGTAHQQKMWAFKNYEECKAYQQEHHQTMDARAKEQGKVLPVPRANACDRMQARGSFK